MRHLFLFLLSVSFVVAGVVQDVAILNRESYQIKGNSMIPILKENDIIVIHKQPLSTLKEGMMVLFHDGNDLVCHSIVSTNGTIVITRGMNNSKNDNTLITASNYEGVVYAIFHNSEPLNNFKVAKAKSIK